MFEAIMITIMMLLIIVPVCRLVIAFVNDVTCTDNFCYTKLLVTLVLIIVWPMIRDDCVGRQKREIATNRALCLEGLRVIKAAYPNIPFDSCRKSYIRMPRGQNAIRIVESVKEHEGIRYHATMKYNIDGIKFFFSKPELATMTIHMQSVEKTKTSTHESWMR